MAGGGRTRSGAVVRADCVEGLTEPGGLADDDLVRLRSRLS